MNKTEEKSLFSCLHYAKVACLPDPIKSDDVVWIRAIAKVWKVDNSHNFCIVENDGNNNPRIVKGYGNVAAVHKFEALYPYKFLSENFLPDLKSRKEIRKFLVANGLDEEYAKELLSVKGKTEEKLAEDNKKVIDYVYRVAIYNNLRELNIIESEYAKE